MSKTNKTGIITLRNWRDFTKVMKLLSGKRWLYRGHDNSSWKLQTSLEREMENRSIDRLPEAERSAIGLFKANAKLLGMSWDSDIEALVAMQHHEAKTRLLDFTTSIFVALFFAFEKMHKTPKSRVIYAVNFNALCNSKTLMNCATEMDWGAQWERIVKIGGSRDGFGISLEDAEFRRLISEMSNAVIHNGCNIEGILPLYTAATNKRQQVQAGVQLMPCTFKPFVKNLASALDIDNVALIEDPDYVINDVSHIEEQCLALPTSLIKLVFDPSMNKDAWDVLDQANINPFTIYPDLTGLAKSIRYTSWLR